MTTSLSVTLTLQIGSSLLRNPNWLSSVVNTTKGPAPLTSQAQEKLRFRRTFEVQTKHQSTMLATKDNLAWNSKVFQITMTSFECGHRARQIAVGDLDSIRSSFTSIR